MQNILDIQTTDYREVVGFKKGYYSPTSSRYVLYLPSGFSSEDMTFGEIFALFSGRIKDVTFDYLTIHDGDYSEGALCGLKECLHRLNFSDNARINKPIKLGLGML